MFYNRKRPEFIHVDRAMDDADDSEVFVSQDCHALMQYPRYCLPPHLLELWCLYVGCRPGAVASERLYVDDIVKVCLYSRVERLGILPPR